MRTLKDKINEKEAYKYRKTADNAYLKIREAVKRHKGETNTRRLVHTIQNELYIQYGQWFSCEVIIMMMGNGDII
jgi:hypothetical protein